MAHVKPDYSAMTEREAELYITMAYLHGPSTREGLGDNSLGNMDPIQCTSKDRYWVYRSYVCYPNFNSLEQACRHYCQYYNVKIPLEVIE
jgi:hypothetical protein